MTTSNVGVVIVHFNNFPQVLETIEGVRAQGIQTRQLVVVDNSASPALADWLSTNMPDCRLLAQQGNVGYGEAVNIGIAELARRNLKLALVLTHEVLLEEGCLDALARAMEEPRVAATGPIVYRRNNPTQAWSFGGDVDRASMYPRTREHWIDNHPAWMDGCCFLIDIAAFQDIDGMYAPYFLYLEEVDFFLRLARAGYELRLVADKKAFQEPGQMPRHYAIRNHILLSRRLASLPRTCTLVLRHIALSAADIVRPRQSGRARLERWRAVVAGLRVPAHGEQ